MVWVSVGGIVAVVVVALVVAARQGKGWWKFLLAGAAGWLVAQWAKGLIVLPLAAAYGHGSGLARGSAILSTLWWFPVFGALLAGVWEELGKYVPLRWLRVDAYGQALALGLGAGALEALVLAAGVMGAAGAGFGGETAGAALISVWERFWAIALHAGLATADGLAVVRRRVRWLLLAIGLHTAADLGAGWYQHTAAVHAGAAQAALLTAELVAAAVAVVTWMVGRRIWAADQPSTPA